MIYCIIGFTGLGKSTLAAKIAERDPTRAIFDPRIQFFTTSDILPNSLELFELLDERYEVIVQPGRGASVEDSFAEFSKQIADWIQSNPEESICMLVDEGRLVGLDSKSVPLDFDWILRSAREGSNIDVIITCHRPVDLSTNIRAIANRLVFFRVTLPNDLEDIEAQCGPLVADEVAKLLDREFVVWNNSRQTWWKVTDPSTWFVDLESVKSGNLIEA